MEKIENWYFKIDQNDSDMMELISIHRQRKGFTFVHLESNYLTDSGVCYTYESSVNTVSKTRILLTLSQLKSQYKLMGIIPKANSCISIQCTNDNKEALTEWYFREEQGCQLPFPLVNGRFYNSDRKNFPDIPSAGKYRIISEKEEQDVLQKYYPKHTHPYHGLNVGYGLLQDVICDWSKKEGRIYLDYKGDIARHDTKRSNFVNDRTIAKFKLLENEWWFLVSGTSNVYLKCEGFKEFNENYFKVPESVTTDTTVKLTPENWQIRILSDNIHLINEYRATKDSSLEPLKLSTCYSTISKDGWGGTMSNTLPLISTNTLRDILYGTNAVSNPPEDWCIELNPDSCDYINSCRSTSAGDTGWVHSHRREPGGYWTRTKPSHPFVEINLSTYKKIMNPDAECTPKPAFVVPDTFHVECTVENMDRLHTWYHRNRGKDSLGHFSLMIGTWYQNKQIYGGKKGSHPVLTTEEFDKYVLKTPEDSASDIYTILPDTTLQQLTVGQHLPSQKLNDWGQKHKYYKFNSTCKFEYLSSGTGASFMGDRVIGHFVTYKGVQLFSVSGTANLYMQIAGFDDFLKPPKKSFSDGLVTDNHLAAAFKQEESFYQRDQAKAARLHEEYAKQMFLGGHGKDNGFRPISMTWLDTPAEEYLSKDSYPSPTITKRKKERKPKLIITKNK